MPALRFEPVLIDGAVTPNFLDAIARQLPDCCAFGVSLLTGPMIRDAIAASKLVRERAPHLPIIYGGWHPTLLTGETLRENFVDVVVRHQGEITLIEVLRRLLAQSSLDMVAGCWFKRDGNIFSNQDRPAISLSAFPPPAYDLVDFEAYARATGGRKLPFATSIGCPPGAEENFFVEKKIDVAMRDASDLERATTARTWCSITAGSIRSTSPRCAGRRSIS